MQIHLVKTFEANHNSTIGKDLFGGKGGRAYIFRYIKNETPTQKCLSSWLTIAWGSPCLNVCFLLLLVPTSVSHSSQQEKTESLLTQYDDVSHLNSERYARLERAQVLVNQFWETYEELNPWLEETQVLIGQLPPPAIDYEHLKQQQEDMRVNVGSG